MATKTKAGKTSTGHSRQTIKASGSANGSGSYAKTGKVPAPQVNEYGIPDWRLERPEFEVVEVSEGQEVHYEIRGQLDTPVPPIRESKYLKKEQYLEIY